jgi:hypothetical protein
MGLGIADTIQLAATLVFALPVALLGGQFLIEGRTFLGGVLLVVGILMVVLQHYLTTPADIPGAIAGKALSRAVKVPDEDEE